MLPSTDLILKAVSFEGIERLLLDGFRYGRAALRRVEIFVDRDAHPILVRRQNDR